MISGIGHLVIKPTLACNANCETCSTRKTLHRSKIKDLQLGMEDWRRLFAEVDALGLSKLTVSGGEPTLYPGLLELIAAGKNRGWEIGLNTNGSLIDETRAVSLQKAGLDRVMISLYSAEPELHDRIRRHPGLWQKAVNAVQIFAGIRDSTSPSLRVVLQTILCRENFRAFPDLLRLAYRLKCCGIAFSYLEGDFTAHRFLLTAAEVREFKQKIVPAAQQVICEAATDAWATRMAAAAVASLYPGPLSAEEYAQGIYRPAAACAIPSFFSMVLANGDVHPCNMVEYTHEPVIGNLHDNSFTELWRGAMWRQFRERGFENCRYCPAPQCVYIPIARRPEYAWLQYVVRYSRLRWLYPLIKRWVFPQRKLLALIRGKRSDDFQ